MHRSDTEALEQANECLRTGDLAQAQAICRDILRANQRNLRAIEMLSAAAFQDARYDDARTFLKRCISLVPREAKYHARMAQVEMTDGRYAEALSRLERAEKIDPRMRISPAMKAYLLRVLGRADDARRLIEPIVNARKEDPETACAYAELEIADKRFESAVAVAERHAAGGPAPLDIRRQLYCLIGTALDKLGRIDDAFEAYRQANAQTDVPFDPDEHARFTDRLIEVFSAADLTRLPRAADASELPVFIAGMPRSGTTLIEQIIDAHPKARGGGEMPDLTRIVRRLPQEIDSNKPFPECVEDLDAEAARRLADVYLSQCRRMARGKKRVVNKNLDNYQYVGLIALLFPNARVIHSRRDPLDTCWSCYTMNLQPNNQPWACDLGSTGLACRQSVRLMEHWSTLPGVHMLEVRYEDLVADLETQSRRLIEFLGLDWDDRCLRFHESGRIADSLSQDQVRRPVYRTSVGRHAKYDRYLQPLRDALAGRP